MTKIKYIHCFGTSYTAGGGFEFESFNEERNRYLRELYSNSGEEFSQYNFSWPGQLQKLLGDSFFVLNHAKQGHGNDRTMRLSYELINNSDFNPDENLFIIEFAGFGRDGFYSKDVGDFIVCNYQTIFNDKGEPHFKFVGAAKSYMYDSKEVTKSIEMYDEFFNTYVDKFVDFEVSHQKLIRETDMYLSYLEKSNINFIFSVNPILNYVYDESKEVEFGDGKYFKKSNNFVHFLDINKLTITDETNTNIQDGHGGLKLSKITADCIYNKIINDGYLNLPTKHIDWEWYYKKNFLAKLV